MKHITEQQRYTISAMKKHGYSNTEIAKIIGKNKSSVGRELKRNSDKRDGVYKAELAQRKAHGRHKNKTKRLKFTSEVKAYVEKKIKDDWSPEEISGRAKLDRVNCVSHECIYQYIWQNKRNGGELYLHLRRHGKKYRKRGSLKDSRGIIKNRISIDERPEIVKEKNRFGDLEIDTVIGKNHKGALLTINDRFTSLVWIRRLEGKHAEPLIKKTIEALMPMKVLLHTITGDNGKEFAGHQQIAKELNLDFYFAHPYHSWERGANENTNGLIRQYFPKGSSFENITDKQVAYVQNKLNNRPRKRLGYLSPVEYFYKFVRNKLNQKVAFVS